MARQPRREMVWQEATGMNSLKRALATVGASLSKLNTTQKLLAGAIGMIALLGLLLVGQLAGRPAMVDLMTTDAAGDTVTFLRANHIDAQLVDGKVMVTPGARRAALATLAENGRLPDDTAILFNNLLTNQKWTNSREQNQQLYTVALQNELSRVIANFNGIRSASVVLDVPEPRGLGMIARTPTASVAVESSGGLSQGTVDAIAALVAGARAGLDIANVKVVDSRSGRQFSASSSESIAATTYLEQARAHEALIQGKLREILHFVPNVIVAVTAQVNVARESSQITTYLPTADPANGVTEGSVQLESSISTSNQSTEQASRGGEAGMRSNATANINSGAGGGTSSETSSEDIAFENRFGQKVTQRMDPKGMATRIAASVNVPESFVVELLKLEAQPAEGGGDAAAPTREQIDARFEQLKATIEGLVRPHLRVELGDGTRAEGELFVAMAPFMASVAGGGMQSAGLFGSGGSGIGGMLGIGGGMIDTLLVAVLAVVSLGMMVMMVKKAARSPDLPTAEELVGIPPPLESASDLIGEANESDLPMTGIEVEAGDMERAKMLQQVADMVREDPAQAAKLLNRWIQVDD